LARLGGFDVIGFLHPRRRVVAGVLGVATAVSVAVVAAPAASAVARPVVTNVTPGSGTPVQANWVTLTGAGFTSASTVTFGSVRGGQTRVVSSTRINVRAPAHRLGSFYVHVTTAAGTSPASATNRYVFTAAPAALAVRADHVIGTPSDLSCPTTTFCMIVEQSGDAVTYNGTTTGGRQATGLNAKTADLLHVTCTSPAFCLATSGSQASTYNGSHWSTPQTLDPTQVQPIGLACVSPTFCLAGGRLGRWFRFDGTSWHRATLTDHKTALMSISCVTSSFCLAADLYGHTWKWDGHRWADQGGVLGGKFTTDAVSCTSVTYCLATYETGTGIGRFRRYDGTTWTPNAVIASNFRNPWKLSCTSGPVCVVLNDAPEVARYNGTTWTVSDVSVPSAEGAYQTALSCASGSQCRLIDTAGEIRTSTGGTWGAAVSVDPNVREIDAVSCPSATFCAATDHTGAVITYDGAGWSSPQTIDAAGHLTAISCPSASACFAVDDAGNVVTYNGGSWSTPTPVDGNGALQSVSCPSPAFCMAVDGAGYVVAYSDSRWHGARRLVGRGGLTSVSCSSTAFCYAVGTAGYAVKYTGHWQAPRKIGADWLTSVSCASPRFCVVGTSDDGVRTFTGAAWSRHVRFYFDSDFGGGDIESISCVTARFCGVGYYDNDNLTGFTLDGAAFTYQDVNVDPGGSAFPGYVATSCWAVGACVAVGGSTAEVLG
jgi:hypothetical protein